MRKIDVKSLYSKLEVANPNPIGELFYTNTYTLLVAVVLSAQATDLGVNKATKLLFKKVRSPEKMLQLGLVKLKFYIKSIGLFNTKAKNIIQLSQILVEKHSGRVPKNRDELESLPGVGRKTANVVLNIGFGKPTIAVDTHVFRVSNRTGLASGKTPLEIEKKLDSITPAKYKTHAHMWLILHGRYICKARNPICDSCIISDYCVFFKRNSEKT